jgi:hypothetical protein
MTTQVIGTSITDKIFNTAVFRGYSPESAAAIAATISVEGAGAELIPFRGERYKRYSQYCEKNNLNVLNPDSKIAYIFDDLTNYNASKIKYSRTVDEAITNFNEGYLGKTLNTTEFLTLAILANDLNKIFVGTE